MVDSDSNLSQSNDESHQRIERLVALGMIANGVVHELTNPLNSVVMNAELGLIYLQQGAERETLEDVLRTIVNETKRAGTLAHGITEFARSTDYAPSDQVELSDIITNARNLLGSKLRRHSVELVVQVEEQLAPISANPLALALAIASLIELSIESGITRVTIAATQSASELVLTVENSGPLALSESHYTKLLMALVNRIFADHQATLTVNNATDFSVRFPNNSVTG